MVFYRLDQEINDRGVLVDRELVEQSITCDLLHKDIVTNRAYEVTGLENPNSVSQLKGWLSERGVEIDSLSKGAVAELIEDADGEVLEALKLRLLMAKTSVKKYEAIERSVCSDGRVHGLLQFYGANRTGRWAGRLVQVQNLPQNHISDLELARSLVRRGQFEELELFYESTPNAGEFIIGHPVCALILDMGLGKTVVTLTALWELALDYFEVGKVLIIAPFRVARDTWKEELEKWDHLKGLSVSVVVGSEKERLDALEKKASVYVINRENVVWLCEKHHWDFDMIVIDELSSFKSYQAKRFKALRRYRPKAIRVVGLTGTPGNLMDLWAEIGILDMGQRLGRYIGAYRDRFFLPDKRNRNIIYS